jgi:hypothetical protein
MVESAETLGTDFHGLTHETPPQVSYCRNKRFILFIADAFIMNTFEPTMGFASALKRSVPSRIEICRVFVCSGGVRLSPLRTPVTIWHTAPAPDDGWWWVWSSWWNEWQGKPKYSEKSAPMALCSPQIPHGLTWARIRAVSVGYRLLTAWATARPFKQVHGHSKLKEAEQQNTWQIWWPRVLRSWTA